MQFVIHSRSERGFWSNDLGWVLDIKDATRFPVTHFNLPVSRGNDAEWIPVSYED